VFLVDKDTKKLLTSEDGFVETATAAWFLIASGVFLCLFWKDKPTGNLCTRRINRNVFLLLLGVLCFVAFGEEISWGQRILGLETPDALKQINRQKELNLHNIYYFIGRNAGGTPNTVLSKISIARLFQFFWFSYFCVIPIMTGLIPKVSRWLKVINLPIVPIGIGGLFLLNYILSRVTALVMSSVPVHRVVEIKECNFAFLFFVVSVWLVKDYQSRGS